MIDFVDIDKNLPGGENMGGLAQNCIFGYWDDVAQWPAAPVAPADIEANGVLVGDLVMKAGRRAFTFYSTDDTSELKMSPVGEVDGKSFEMALTVFNPGLKKKILGFMNAAKNENLFFIVSDSDGQYYILGDKLRAAKFESGEVGTGKATGDRKGATLTFKFKTNNLRAYIGDVTALIGGSSS
jgi:hypothetical protein